MARDLALGTCGRLLVLMALLFGAIGLPTFSGAQDVKQADEGTPWTLLARAPVGEALAFEWVRPARGQLVSLDLEAMKKLLAGAPWEETDRARQNPLVIVLPDPSGNWQRFAVVEYAAMEPAMAAAHPELRTYRGAGIDDPYATLRCSTTTIGFQAQVLTISEASHGAAWHIDPRTRGDLSSHTSYYRNDASDRAREFICHTVDSTPPHPHAATSPFQHRSTAGPTRRQYRLAMAVTGETTVWANANTTGGAIALVTNIVNQLNGIYETEFAVRFVLVANESAIIYPNGATDPFTSPATPGTTNGNLETLLDAASPIGPGNYDVGHVIHYSPAGNHGLAGGIGTICVSGIKGSGYSGYTNPNDAYFVIDYVSHELGHQFGGRHVQNNCNGAGGDSGVYLIEPGSGSTIMSYAGICGTTNLQAHNDPYFNGLNIEQILTYLSGTTCAANISTGNGAPVIGSLSAYTIPAKTPFTLTASATDPNGDAITYCWEEQDGSNTTAYPPTTSTDNGSNSLVRSFSATASAARTVPRLATILANTTDPAESLPQVARTMRWRVTVRDNRSGGGGVNQASVNLTIAGGTGPFAVTAPNTGGTFSGPISAAWGVAGTNGAPINCASVRISLSTDGGQTFPIILASSVPNTGTAAVTLPNVATTTARIKVEAVGNIFFDISNTDFTIIPTTPTGSCCAPDGSCAVTVQGSCAATWTTGASCTPANPCPQPVGNCCAADGSCTLATPAQCAAGTWGMLSSCSPNPCPPPPPPPGTCCAGAGTCSFVAQASCTGLWNLGGACTPNPCTPFLATILVTRSGSGSGVVRSIPAGIDCAAICGFAFPTGGALTLVPTPNPGSVFDGWAGGSDGTCAGTGNCAFIVAGPISVNAVFRCRADFNGVGGTNVQDIFDFLAAWFVGDPRADFNGVGGNTVQDIFEFLSAWFAGCP